MKKESVACIILDESGRILIAHRKRIGQMGGRWEFPGGKVEENESAESAIKREMQEEFGIAVLPGKKIAETVFVHNNENVLLTAYEVSLLPGEKEKDWVLTEHTEINWVACDVIPLMHFVDSDMLLYPAVKEYLTNKK